MRKEFNEALYLAEMYDDEYFPGFLVDKIRDLLKEGVGLLEAGERDTGKIQKKFDEITIGINALENEFDENDSEIETAARESIGQTLRHIIKHFCLDIDDETLMRERNW